MPVVSPGNSFLVGIDRQTDESTVASVANFSAPTYTGARIGPVREMARVEVTDGASIEGDPYAKPVYWDAAFSMPMLAACLGQFCQAMWPTDGITGAGPYTHAFSGLGGTQPWIALYSEWPGAGAFEQTFGKGIASSIGFAAAVDGGPGTLEFAAVGQSPTVAAYTVTTADSLANGYFTMTGGTIEIDVDTPNVNPSSAVTNVQSFTLTVDRPATPAPTADATTVARIAQGKVATALQMSWLYDSWDAYRASYYGAVAGTTGSTTIVYGAAEFSFVHSVQAGWSFKLYVPKVAFQVDPVTPDASGGPLTMTVNGWCAAPSSGDRVQPTLINATSTAYSAL